MARSFRQQTLTVMAVALCLSLATAQTFEYSRGWTNGRKRSEGSLSVVRGPASSPILGLLSSQALQMPGKYSYGFQSVRSRFNALENSLVDAFRRNGDLFVGGDAPTFAEN
ncbi:pro-corazonin-like isoform X1 [Penaeus monodon]|uniref:pro-corazonin-like isoform X1 n=1 Tax=Penaeus monodon TaxID=6687 RepID=UPI0018A7CBF3|nr:pro-corazonin-like isoform X1 [Penaeus monodon]